MYRYNSDEERGSARMAGVTLKGIHDFKVSNIAKLCPDCYSKQNDDVPKNGESKHWE